MRYSADLLRSAQEWEKAGRHREYLYSGNRLARAEQWLERGEANQLQKQFVETALRIQTATEFRQALYIQLPLTFFGGFIAMG